MASAPYRPPRHPAKKTPPRRYVGVLKMLATMEQTPEANKDLVEDFLTTGRTGRRNAMADILGEHAATGSGDLSERMEGLSTDPTAPGPSTSSDAQKASGPAGPAGPGGPGGPGPSSSASSATKEGAR